MTPNVHRIAMWSGPRNISTALMRAWENRPDTMVHDEPFYAYYLKETGIPHPGAEEIMATYPTNANRVMNQLLGAVPEGITIYYQKHMCHHIPRGTDMFWTRHVTNCFLIRHPAHVITSLAKVIGTPTLQQTGFLDQYFYFLFLKGYTDDFIPVIDAADVLADPRRILSMLCDVIGVPFDEAMLSWPAGPRDSDGIWAPYWYKSVEQSTGFLPPSDPEPVPPELQPLVDQCITGYEKMLEHALR